MKLDRRNLLLAPLALLFPSFAKAEPKVLCSEYGLGKYINHHLTPKLDDVWFSMDEYKNRIVHRYLGFPIEANLVIKFEKGEETYLAFNANKWLCNYVNTISYQKLLNHQVKSLDGKPSQDNYATVFQFENQSGYKCKFHLTSVTAK